VSLTHFLGSSEAGRCQVAFHTHTICHDISSFLPKNTYDRFMKMAAGGRFRRSGAILLLTSLLLLTYA
jgi:hypothetical protein